MDYFDDGDKEHKVREAEVLFIAPGHPDEGIMMVEPMTRKNALSNIDEDLDERHWGSGLELHPKKVDRLTFCCCECCHGYACQGFLKRMCGAFSNIPPLINFSRQRCLLLTTGRDIAHTLKQKPQSF